MTQLITREKWDEIIELADVPEDASGASLHIKGNLQRPWVRGVENHARFLLAASSLLDHDHARDLFGKPRLSGAVLYWPDLVITEYGEDWVAS